MATNSDRDDLPVVSVSVYVSLRRMRGAWGEKWVDAARSEKKSTWVLKSTQPVGS